MKSMQTKTREILRFSWLLFDYSLWWIFGLKKFNKIDTSKIKNILIIHFGAIGELIITTPLVEILKNKLNANIYYMVSEGKEDILKDNPKISKIIAFNHNNKTFSENIENYN